MSVLVKVVTNWLRTDRGKERCPGMIITCAQIQVAGKIVERSSHNARLTELNTSDETFLRDDHHYVVRDQSLPWRKDVSRRPVASVEEGRESQRSRFRGGRT